MTDMSDRPGASRHLPGPIWLALAVVAMLSVLIVNGRPLFYFDTAGYVAQGETALTQLGWRAKTPPASAAATVTAAAPAAEGTAPTAAPATSPTADMSGKGTVDGSRSAVYALFAGIFSRLGALEGLIALNVAAVLLSVWLMARTVLRSQGGVRIAPYVALPIIVACLGSLPFFVAYLMPDTLAPVMILNLALLGVYGRQMRWWEVLLALGLASLAIVSHLSHLAIAALMLPVTLIVGMVLGDRRWWLLPALVAAVLAVGYGERVALRAAASAVARSDVVIKPFITARLIQDGPGRSYLDRHCPDAAIATCALAEALSHSDNPMRFTASHIVFQTSPELGSFRLLTHDEQTGVSQEQVHFFLEVLKDAPLQTTLAFVHNMLKQTVMFSVDMTIPTASQQEANATVHGTLSGSLVLGRLALADNWIGPLTVAQGAVYAVSLLLILMLCLMPGRVSPQIRALALVVVAGILANALVCGGISQPATRYGARVIWLLPLMATLMTMVALRPYRRLS